MKLRTLKHLASFKSRLSLEETVESRAASKHGKLERYAPDGREEPKWVRITKIVVPTEHDKEQVLLALGYLHDCFIDTDLIAVNILVHTYPAQIVVEEV